jgi:hypothetical protein
VDAKDVAIVIQALAVTIAAFSAVFGINAWRRQLIGGKRAEVAERVLTAFYEARDIFASARLPASFAGEGRTRERAPGETEDQARSRDAYFTPAERLIASREFFMALNASRDRFIAYFGHDAAGPFATILQVRNRLLISARMLGMTTRRDDGRLDYTQWERWEADIWDLGDGDILC